MTVAALLLAAGGSTRMGSVKQLLPYRGSTLVRHAAMRLGEAGFASVTVVVGNAAGAVAAALDGLPIDICPNDDWERGIGSSIRAGVCHIQGTRPSSDGIVIALADQPLVPVEHFAALKAALSETWPLVASGYDGTAGVPAAFGRRFFAELAAVDDAGGAKQILRTGPTRIIPLARSHDIDSPDDYGKLLGLS